VYDLSKRFMANETKERVYTPLIDERTYTF